MLITKADDQKRIVVPQAKPGQVYAIHEISNGSFTLIELDSADSAAPKCSLAKEDGFTVVVPGQPIDERAI
jgi:hypothetical protein